jgi:nucleoside-diphosphate-sugar epimerase
VRIALVTGATGLVGSHVVERLLTDGWRVRALVRDPASAAWLAARGVEVVRGDVLDAPALTRAADGCAALFHTAAAVTPRGGWEAFRRPNVDGTRNVIAAAGAGGARLLHLSSVAVYGPSARYRQDGHRTDEETPLAPLPDGAWYARSKRESEALVLDAHADGKVWATAIRPCVIYGPRDRQFVPRLARVLRFGFAPLLGRGRTTLPLVHAASVADGAVRAVTTDVAGGRVYNVTNDFALTSREFFTLAGRGMGRRVRLVPMPAALASLVVRLGLRAVSLLRGGTLNVVASGSLDFLTKDNPFTSARARRELGWAPPVPPEEGVPAAFRWWVEHRGA